MWEYLKVTNFRVFRQSSVQIRRGYRISYWWSYWIRLQRTSKYRAWWAQKNAKKAAKKPSQPKQTSGPFFQIKSRMQGGMVLFVAEYMGESHYRLRIRKPRGDRREWFYFDKKSKSVRFAHDQRFVLGLQHNH